MSQEEVQASEIDELLDIVIEDGSCVVGANSFVSYAETEEYCCTRGLWEPSVTSLDDDGEPVEDTATIDKKQQAIIRACDALNVLEWQGTPFDAEQGTCWPRTGVLDVEPSVIPHNVKKAQMELAALVFSGSSPLAASDVSGKVTAYSKSEGSVDVIGGDSVSYTFGKPTAIEPHLPAVYGLIRKWLKRVPGEQSSFSVGEVARA